MWSKVLGFITGTPKIVDDVFDKDDGLLTQAGGFINDLNYSDVEKARDCAGLAKAVSIHIASTLSESTVRSRTRRKIAETWIRVQLGLVLMVAICIPLDKAIAKDYFDLATCNIMLYGTGSIIVFFFGAYVWGTYIKKGKQDVQMQR